MEGFVEEALGETLINLMPSSSLVGGESQFLRADLRERKNERAYGAHGVTRPTTTGFHFVCAKSMKTRGPRSVFRVYCSSSGPRGMARPSQFLSCVGLPSTSSM